MWTYEPDQWPKRKHHWSQNKPGFDQWDGYPVGKCPSEMTREEAEALLNSGIPVPPANKAPYPKRIYVVHNGAVYRATPTNPGKSYHGFPESGEELRRLPGKIRNKILARAKELGCESEVRAWIQQ